MKFYSHPIILVISPRLCRQNIAGEKRIHCVSLWQLSLGGFVIDVIYRTLYF